MCAATDQLKNFDTPQALPVLGILDKRAPSRPGVLISFLLGSLFILALFGGVLIVAAAVVALLFQAYRWLLSPMVPEQNTWLIVWGVVFVLTIYWLIIRNVKLHAIVRCYSNPPEVRLPSIWRGLLWLARQVTRILMLTICLVGIVSLLFPVFYGLTYAWGQLQAFEPIRLGPIQPLQEYLGLDPFISIGSLAILVAAALVAVLLVIGAPHLLLGAFWALGLWTLYQTAAFDQVQFAIVAGLAAAWPLKIPYIGAKMLGWSYHRWFRMIQRLLLGWALRDSLSAAFAAHRVRNSQRVKKNGAAAVCKQDLAFFVQQRAGPVSYWWCPECHDDHSAYTGVKLVRGVLDLAQTARYRQDSGTLLVNLRAWQDGAGICPAPPLQDVYIGKLADPHEAEMFITQYHSVQAERKWPSLGKVTAIIAPDSNLDENARRQVQRNLRAA
jgi:hypothetical protein